MDYAQQQRSPGRHVVGIGVVIAMHVLVAWALVSGLARKVVDVIKAPIETKIIEEVQPPPPPPPENLPPPPKFAPPPPSFVPPPEVVINNPPPPAPTITVTPEPPPPAPPVAIAPPPVPEAPPAPAPPPAPPAPPPRAVQPAIANVAACAPTARDYPAAALRAEATGTTKIEFTVGPDGKLTSADVVSRSGLSREHRMLDRVALDKLSECSFKAGVDASGKPMGGKFEVEYVWRIQ